MRWTVAVACLRPPPILLNAIRYPGGLTEIQTPSNMARRSWPNAIVEIEKVIVVAQTPIA